MKIEKIIFWRNFLFRSFLIGLVFAVLTFIIIMLFRSTFEMWAFCVFGVEAEEFREAVFASFMNMRLILLFLFLAPAIAMHWMVLNDRIK